MRRLVLIHLGATGALASAITNSSVLVVIANSLGQNPSFFVLMFSSSATGSWMKAIKEYYNTMSACSPFFGFPGMHGFVGL